MSLQRTTLQTAASGYNTPKRSGLNNLSQPQPGLGSGSSPPTSNPQPGLGSGSSPPVHPLQVSPKFGSLHNTPVSWGTIVGPGALSQTGRDILGVWVPKIPLVRSGIQFFEETFLEFVEDAAFYFSTALASLAIATGFKKAYGALSKGKEKDINDDIFRRPDLLGHRNNVMKEEGKKIAKKWKVNPAELERKLIGHKFATLFGALALASGFEYMIQHVKNVITAKQFKARNFTAVAGLEKARNEAVKGEQDPVEKAKKRAWQVGALTGLGLLGAIVSPKLIMKSPKLASIVENNFLKWMDYGKGKAFDLSKPILALLAGVGAVSYIDASRDSLERKENATRLSVVIPYMLFGTELVGYAMGKWQQAFGKVQIGQDPEGNPIYKKISDLKGFSFLKNESMWDRFKNSETFMDIGVLKGKEEIIADFKKLEQQGHKLEREVELDIASKVGRMGLMTPLISAAITGIGINVIAYKMTKERHRREQAARAQQVGAAGQPNAASATSPWPNAYANNTPVDPTQYPTNNRFTSGSFRGQTLQSPRAFQSFQSGFTPFAQKPLPPQPAQSPIA